MRALYQTAFPSRVTTQRSLQNFNNLLLLNDSVNRIEKNQGFSPGFGEWPDFFPDFSSDQLAG